MKGSTLSAICKVVKKVNFPLDTKHKMCYTKYVIKGGSHRQKGICTMTNREFFAAVASANLSDEMTAKAQELIASLDARNDKRKSADSKEKRETAERREKVLAFLKENSNGLFSRKEIAEATELTEGQVTSACTALVKAELVTKSETKVDKTKKVVYSIKE